MNKLKFSFNNSKMKELAKLTGKKVATFDLPAGWTCPGARECLSKCNPITGKIKDGSSTKFRCYAASLEACFPAARRLRWHNFYLLHDTSSLYNLIDSSLPSKIEILRLHSSGDFFNLKYLDTWRSIAQARPKLILYGYTKSPHWLTSWGQDPPNMHIVYSLGGRYDDLAFSTPVLTCRVVQSSEPTNYSIARFGPEEGATSELHIINGIQKHMELVIHGTQPKKTTQD